MVAAAVDDDAARQGGCGEGQKGGGKNDFHDGNLEENGSSGRRGLFVCLGVDLGRWLLVAGRRRMDMMVRRDIDNATRQG